jgi:two-component system CheB/CheR fusion protein
LAADAFEVLRTLIFIQKQIATRDGRWFSVRIMPYRTFDDRIDGLVITFINISDLKQLEINYQEKEQLNRLLIDSSSDVIINLSTDLKILEFNSEAETFFDKKRDDAVNQYFIHMFIPETVQKKTEKDMNEMLKILTGGKFKMQVITAGGNVRVVEWSANVMRNNLMMPTGIIIMTKK